MAVATLAGLLGSGLPGCVEPMAVPFVERESVRLSVLANFTETDIEDADGSGPFPTLEAVYSTVLHALSDEEISLELGGRYLELAPGGEFEGEALGVLIGGRWLFQRDRRLRPSWSAGGTWTTFNFTDQPADEDFKGPGVYVGGALDYYWTPTFALGVELRAHLHYWNAHRDDHFAPSADAGFHAVWRF